MSNFIEELYYGNIDPQARGYRPKSPVKKVSDSLNDLEEKLTEQLEEVKKQNKELVRLLDINNSLTAREINEIQNRN